MKMISLCALALTLMTGAVQASQTISLPEIPGLSESAEEGIFPNLVQALEAETARDFAITLQPFARSIRSVSTGESAAHIPLLDPENGSTPGPGLMFGTTPLYYVTFSIYHRSDTPIDPNNLSELNVVTDIGHTQVFDFETEGTSCIPCALKKVAAGRGDAVIFATVVVDGTIEAEGIEGLAKIPYGRFPVKFVLQDGNAELDQILGDGIRSLEASGQLQSILGPLME